MTGTPDSVLRPVDDATRALARHLLDTASRATLASLAPGSGWPYASLVTIATTTDGAPLLLLSGLSIHTRALDGDARCSLLIIDESSGRAARPSRRDPLTATRMTVFGRARFLALDDPLRPSARQRFLERQPKAALYADFADFRLAVVDIDKAALNAGFGRAHALTADDLRL